MHGLVAAVSSTLLCILVSITLMYQSKRYTVYPEILAGIKINMASLSKICVIKILMRICR